MNSLTADEALSRQLAQVNRVTEVRDGQGQLLGYYAPAPVAEQVPAIKLAALFDPEEIRRRKALKQPGYSIEQVRQHLQKLADDPKHQGR